MELLLESIFLAIIFLACSSGSMAPASMATPGSSTSNITDHLALMSFKSLITSDPAGALASWGNQSVSMCQWHGVTCGLRGRRRGRVVVLDLAKLNLLGMITPALGNLTYMRQLYLPWNRFHGNLPPELGNLHDLEILHLNYNSIGGQIPPSLSNCSRVVDISLHSNKLQGRIPSEFSSLHNLEALDLGQNMLTGTFPPEFGSLINLRRLNLRNNNLTGEIPEEIGILINLVWLNLDYNQFSGTIPASLGNLSALTFLSIYSNNLRGSIPSLQGLSSISTLGLGKNSLTGSIPSWMGNLSSLTIFDLQNNGMVGQIPESLGNLELLTVLSLSINNLSGPIPHALGNLHSLIEFHLDHNGLEGELPPSIFNLSSLEVLEVQYNYLNGSFPLDVGNNFPKLTTFNVIFNGFHGIIPPSLCNNSMLYIIETTHNPLTGTIPQCLGVRQKSLYGVAFSANNLKATKAADWGFLSGLTNCTNLTLLDIGYNNLQGVLPQSIGNLSKHLWYLNVGANSITGKIPEGICNLHNLEYLYMHDNLLEGSIPTSVIKMSKLSRLYLFNNTLSGFIPPALGNLTNLQVLALQGNALSGVIPSSLGSCPLEQLDLSYNNLTGSIPKELFLISTLSDSMYIHHNLLSGSLPSELGNLENLAALDFSNNRISGEIPTSIGECQSLQYLNTSGNILQGPIPPSLGKLSGLLVLDLSHNNFSGGIPEFLGSLRGLSSLNLSFNKFEGEVPEDGVFLNATGISITGNEGLCGGIPQLKLPPCSNTNTKKPSRKLVIIISICSAVLFITLLLFALSTLYHRTRKMKANMQTSLISEQYMRVSYAELVNATNGFSSENLIGAGSFGSVYKGTMRSNDQQVVVAVKVLNLTQRGASQSFVAECETLRCVRHRNLLKILTVCSSIDFQGRDFKALVYEFLPNGNLDKWLHHGFMEDGEHKALDLHVRLQIAIDVASSLEYLHKYKPLPIIHCDLKASNVLLDIDMVAHVGDFGLARFLHQDSDISSSWAAMRGTVGYAAPEYGLGNEVSIHGDVYSYGILLLEMFTGKRPTDSEFGEDLGLHKYVQMALPDRAANVIDQNLLALIEDGEASTSTSSRDMKIACISSVLHIGISCSAEMPMDRVHIGYALKELQAIRDKFHRELLREGTPSH